MISCKCTLNTEKNRKKPLRVHSAFDFQLKILVSILIIVDKKPCCLKKKQRGKYRKIYARQNCLIYLYKLNTNPDHN